MNKRSLTEQQEIATMRYVRGFTIPRQRPPAGRVLVHNHVRHTPAFVCGQNGFRAWTQVKTRRLVRCACGWAPEAGTHYRVKLPL